MLLTTFSVSIFFLMTRLGLISKICSSNHHIGVHLLIICSFDLCEYLVQTSYDLMLLIWRHRHSRPRDHMSSLTVSLSHKIHLFHWFIRWRFCIYTWPIRSSLFRYFEPPRLSFYSFIIYDSMIVWWVLIRGYMILVHLFMFKCFSLMYLYTNVCVDTFMWFHYVPDMIWSLWDFIIQDLCYLAAWRPKTTWLGTLDV